MQSMMRGMNRPAGDGGLARMIADPAGADFVRVEKFSEAETIVAAQESPDRVLGETGAGE